MFKKRLPETNKTSTSQTRQTAKERGPGILAERFPAISNMISRSKDTLVKGVMELENKKIRDRGYAQIQRNLSTLNNMQALAEEQNDLLRQIIRALREQDDVVSDSRSGRGRPPRARAPGRGRFGQRARARLRRIQTIRRQRRQAIPPAEQRQRGPGADAERARPPAPAVERRTQPEAVRTSPPVDTAARLNADRIITNATESASRTVADAEERAKRVIADAEERARTTVATAERISQKSITQGEEQARALIQDAQEHSRRVIAHAEVTARDIADEATTIRSRAQAEAQTIMDRAQTEAESIRNRERYVAELQRNQGQSDAEIIRKQAQTEADNIRSVAQREADSIRSSAQRAAAAVAPIPEPDALRVVEPERPAVVSQERVTSIPEPDALRAIPEQRPAPVAPIPEPDALRAIPEQRPTVAPTDAARVAASPTQTPDQARQSSGGIRTAGVGAVTGAVAGTPGGTAATGAATGAGLAVAIGGIDSIIARRFASVTMRNIPIVGSAVAGVSAISRVMAGDARGAAMDVSSIGLDIARAFGIAAAATGVGAAAAAGATTAQMGLTIATLTRDVFNEVYEKAYGIPPYRDTEENVRVRSPEIQEKIATSITDFLRSQQPADSPEVVRQEQQQRQSLGIDEPFENANVEKAVRELQIARRNQQANPTLPRLQRVVENRQRDLSSLLQSRRERISEQDRQRAQSFLEGREAASRVQTTTTTPAPPPTVEAAQEAPAAVSVAPEVLQPKSDTQDLLTNLSSPYTRAETSQLAKTPVDVEEGVDRVTAEPIVRSLLREEEMESALPYPENLIDMIGKTEFENIEIDAEKIVFDGEIKLAQREYAVLEVARAQPTVAAQVPTATEVSAPQAPAPASDATQTSAAPVTTTGGTETPAAPAAAAEPQTGGAPSLATPVALPSPAATGIAPAAQPQAAPAPQQSAPSAPQQQGGQGQGGAGAGDFMTQVNEVSGRLGINPANLLAVMRSESSLNPRAVNSSTGASGLIQFMPRTAQSLGTSVEAIRQMSAAEQMPFVERFFRSVRLPAGASAGKLYAYVFLPGRANREVLTQSGENFYEANRGLDVDRDGKITIADLDARLMRFGAVGGAGTATMQAAAPGAGGALAAAGAGMAAADQAQARSGGQTMIVQARNQQAAQQPNVVPPQAAGAEVPLNTRLQKQVA